MTIRIPTSSLQAVKMVNPGPKSAAPATPDTLGTAAANLSPSLARILRPQAAYRWLLPYIANITPTYIESVLRGALAGNHVQAWELFDLMCDSNPEIASCIGEYVDGVTKKQVIIEPFHEEDEEPSPQAVKNQKIVSKALRSMRPSADADEDALPGTIRNILFSRFHGQSVLEVDYTVANGELNLIPLAGIGRIVAPRCTFWVHPVCYGWSMEGRLGLRVALANEVRMISDTAKRQKPGTAGQGGMSMVEPPAWNWMSSQPMPSYLQPFPENKFLLALFKAKAGTALGGSCLRPLAWWVVLCQFLRRLVAG